MSVIAIVGAPLVGAQNGNLAGAKDSNRATTRVAPTLGWQRNYYEHIISDGNDLKRIREYIVNNSAKWQEDEYYVK